MVTISPFDGMKQLMPNSCITFCFRNSILAASPWTNITFLGSAFNNNSKELSKQTR